MDPYLVVARSKIQLGEILSAFEVVQNFINPWQWVAVFDRDGIKSAIIHTEALISIFLPGKENASHEWAVCRLDLSVIEVVLNLEFELRLFRWCHTVNSMGVRLCSGY